MVAAIEYYGTGRRKTSTARVFLRPGSGVVTINRKPIEQAFPTEALRTQIRRPLAVTETAEKFDVLATIAGGGVAGGGLRVRGQGRCGRGRFGCRFHVFLCVVVLRPHHRQPKPATTAGTHGRLFGRVVFIWVSQC